MDSNFDRTALIDCCMLELYPVPESNFLGGVEFIVGLKGLNVVHYEGMSG